MNDVQLLPENEVKEVEGRTYINPQVGIDETNTFIDKFRDTQRGNTQEISEQTQMLGADVPSSLGGLTGAGNYFTSRYQTPQTNAVLQNLRTAAQATALNEAMANEQAMWKKRYNDAYKAYQQRQYKKANSGGGNGGGSNADNAEGEVTYENTDYEIEGVTPGVAGGYTVAQIDTDTGKILGYTGVPYGQEGKMNYNASLNSYSDAGAHVVMRAKKSGDMTDGNSRSGTIRVWKLPNGTTTNVDATYYTIVKDSSGRYYAKRRSTGALTPIGS